LKRKKDSSMVRAIELVKSGDARVAISCGNTGALMAGGTLRLRMMNGIERPALAAVIPRAEGYFILIDAGANPDCKPLHLLQSAIMGSIYSREILGRSNPRVGILSNGTEEMKGTELTRGAAKLCAQANLNFLGYVEGHALFTDAVEVVVTDGFVGNIVLKTCESMGKALVRTLKSELTANPLRKFGALLSAGAFKGIKKRMDPEAYGGAPLLGLNGNVIKAHGSARERAIMNAIRVSAQTVTHQINQLIVTEIANANARIEMRTQPSAVGAKT